MSDPLAKPVDPNATAAEPAITPETEEQLDADEAEFRALRRDLDGVKGASAVGIVAISVGKIPLKNEFFRTHPTFRAIVSIVTDDKAMQRAYFAVSPDMVAALSGIGIAVADYALYLTITSRGALRVIPVRQANGEGEQNEYDRTKELGLVQAAEEWLRLYTDLENKCYMVFPAEPGRYTDPLWPELKPAKIFRLAFKDRGHLIDTPEHLLFKRWASRDAP